ncbi:sensor histidine kinase [Psychrobacillus sp.]|uniref:cache domain-containing sensor histidine kinase n=1 Tax=Psychrobacillus sp. TaxID=1871623 RepID=UPI0028BE4B0A|nr:sensor histidine kinase [Psychrobacillus sp.]
MFRKLMSLKLQTKLMLFFSAITLIPLLLLGIFTYQVSSKMVKEQASTGIMENLTQINKNLAFFSRDIEQLSNYIYRSDLVQEKLQKDEARTNLEKYQDFEQVNALFDSFLGTKNWTINLYIIGFNGDRYFTGDYLPPQYNQISENWGVFRKAKKANGAAVWDTHYTIRHTESQEVVLRVGRLLKNEDSEPIGYLIIDILEPSIAELYQSNYQNSKNQIYLIDSEGYVISGYPSKTTIGTKMTHESINSILQSQRGFFDTTLNNQKYITIFDTNEETHYKIVNYLPEDEVTKNSQPIKYLTLLLIVMASIITIWFTYLFAISITSPINKLKRVMKKVEKGNLDVQFQATYQDEVSELGTNFNSMITKLNTSMKESLEKKSRLQDAEINALRAQINPHFLYNTLETMSAIAKIKGVKMISELAIALAEMMRYSIKKDSEYVLLEEDLLLLERYLFIQEVRFQKKIEIIISVEESAKGLLIPPLLIQPIVENAIIHGLETKVGQGVLFIQIYNDDSVLSIQVKDDGKGMNPVKLAEVTNLFESKVSSSKLGIGLENVVRRVSLYYGESYGLKIDSEENVGTTVIMKLPVIRKNGGKVID